jgi:hypothetical protein
METADSMAAFFIQSLRGPKFLYRCSVVNISLASDKGCPDDIEIVPLVKF